MLFYLTAVGQVRGAVVLPCCCSLGLLPVDAMSCDNPVCCVCFMTVLRAGAGGCLAVAACAALCGMVRGRVPALVHLHPVDVGSMFVSKPVVGAGAGGRVACACLWPLSYLRLSAA